MLSEIPEPWISFLAEIDSVLEEETKFYCIGGFVIAMLHNFERVTSDIDFISSVPRQHDGKLQELAGEGSSLYKKYGVYLDPVTIATPPESYEDRLVEMFPGTFRHLRLYALDPYDIALSKLERNLPRDREDMQQLARTVPFDLEIFKKRYENELRVYLEDTRHRSTFDFWIELIEEERGNANPGK